MALEELRKERKKANTQRWTQKGVAKSLGVSVMTYRKYVENPETMSVQTQHKLARLFDVKPEEITK